LISNDPGPDIENSSSSSWSEFDGSCIAPPSLPAEPSCPTSTKPYRHSF